ncbi:type IV secretory system conjugative DNA transfer family protein [Rhodospirillaceae bacterium KN72]|uniref:Type IV secretory system conjugative DNA transfer family protein n=1 Tax=Pacificispira spongiicola TaxID=2729598 RepID=A0A7Y0DYG6_9PROT|nr:type IV secretory system conjugative DNA transfer family protein [Pacificispira spongiicola]NMM43919.1 type IV secretory system conjugative DNA transfer family protein [Pacificispira spongiicola]
MIAIRLSLLSLPVLGGVFVLWRWREAIGFQWQDARWWQWLWQVVRRTGGLPADLLYPTYYAGGGMILGALVVLVLASRASAATLHGGRGSKALHGSAAWARVSEIRKAGLFSPRGVVVGGWKTWRKIQTLRHDGPEHVMAFMPTRSGKGVGLVIPTLLTWPDSVLVLDIKGENYALTAGYRASIGQRILRFEPTAPVGSIRYNPLREVRVGSGHIIEDCQNIASMIIDPDGKGLKDFWMQSGWEWLSVVILHVTYRVERDDDRRANLKDVNRFMSAVSIGEGGAGGEDSFDAFLDDILAFDHGLDLVDDEVRRGASKMRIKAHPERSGVHSSAAVQLALYADPIVSKNIAESDFRLDDLMNGDRPASLYIVIPPSDIDRLRPLTRILMNQFLRRLTSEMAFGEGRSLKGYKHRLLLMLDEFTSVGKLEIFERALAFMAGYGLKAFIIIQDLRQLRKEYGRDEAITANCHIRIAAAPNEVETAETLSKMAGTTTVVQRKRSRSGAAGSAIGSVSESLQETTRPLMTVDECMKLRGLEKDWKGNATRAGDMLIFPSGSAPILGRQTLYFQDKELLRRARMPAPGPGVEGEETVPTEPAAPPTPAATLSPVDRYEQALNGGGTA